MDKRWFWFELLIAGKRNYIGKCEATLDEVRRAFPYALIEGNGLVTILGKPQN